MYALRTLFVVVTKISSSIFFKLFLIYIIYIYLYYLFILYSIFIHCYGLPKIILGITNLHIHTLYS